ncbi:MAG TPA: hypothetical protein VLE97_01735 [Gaiellaceae bacterium]|nr:hypothetical protein [Gaiellaceae bacterium]
MSDQKQPFPGQPPGGFKDVLDPDGSRARSQREADFMTAVLKDHIKTKLRAELMPVAVEQVEAAIEAAVEALHTTIIERRDDLANTLVLHLTIDGVQKAPKP